MSQNSSGAKVYVGLSPQISSGAMATSITPPMVTSVLSRDLLISVLLRDLIHVSPVLVKYVMKFT